MARFFIALGWFFITSVKIFSQAADNTATIPLAGNTFVTGVPSEQGLLRRNAISWKDAAVTFNTYVYIAKSGELTLAVNADEVPPNVAYSFTVNGVKVEKKFETATLTKTLVAQWNITQPGYVNIQWKATGTSENGYGRWTDFIIGGTAVDEQTAFVRNNEGNLFHFGRRGPSVHLNYRYDNVNEPVEYFYNEILVPEGNDVMGSYFMANGFAEGYFGMQVNSENERRVLFSVWSPFKTDNPREIPQDEKIIMNKKGEEVNTGEFGNEGSGGQSFLRYQWKAGEIQRFLLRGRPIADNYTEYTAWFFDNAQQKWRLIASFSRPKTNTYLKRLHSFLENFSPATGHITRKAYYQNQWVRTVNGKWTAVNKMIPTVDATANKRFRLDYNAGKEGSKFFMQNCGFFYNPPVFKTVYERTSEGQPPVIDVEKLP